MEDQAHARYAPAFWTLQRSFVSLGQRHQRDACHSGAMESRKANMSTVQQETFDIIAKQAKIELDSIKPESTLKDLGIASLDAIEVIFDIEEHFNINLPNEDTDLENGTVGQLIAAIERQLAEKKDE
jgi:acyl carrier protein